MSLASNPTIIKWRTIRPEAFDRVVARLAAVRALEPPGVPRLLSFGFAGPALRLELERVPGRPLADCLRTLDAPGRARVAADLPARLTAWRRLGFVHGDLSPRNILFLGDAVWIIDWVLDPAGFEGTPRFAAPEIRLGRRSFESDRAAAHRILLACGAPLPSTANWTRPAR